MGYVNKRRLIDAKSLSEAVIVNTRRLAQFFPKFKTPRNMGFAV